jgi:transcriptional regulator with PAS, ATPase and Fis domain
VSVGHARKILKAVKTVAPTDSTVLLLGETAQAKSFSRGQSTTSASVASATSCA